ncbi:hypothetical protein C8J56DRAFT_424281 [Mycena floridula]|nr:hypothetical protein C8J56DRAFT_424281 [Mycena floridula]
MTSASVSTLISSNRAPSDSEENVIRQAISCSKQEIQALDVQIAEVRDRLEELLEARQHLVSNLAIHQTILSPIRRIPPEILSDIFEFYVLDAPLAADQGAWLLAKVCADWKSITDTSPRVWAHIKIGMSTRRKSCVLQQHLVRSRKCPLNITFMSERQEENVLLDVLKEHSDRWQHVVLHISISAYRGLSSIRGLLPSLRSLCLSVQSFNASTEIIDAFEIAPLLTRTEMWNMPELSILLPLAQIMSYKDSNVSRIVDTLQQAPELTELSFNILGPKTVIPVSVSLTHENLQKLAITGPAVAALQLLQDCSFPSLLHLELDNLNSRFHPPITSYFRFLSSCKKLERFQLGMLEKHDAKTVVALLECAPSLCELGIKSWVSEEMQQLLSALTMPTPLLPNLRRLRFAGNMSLTTMTFDKMVRSRSNAVSIV